MDEMKKIYSRPVKVSLYNVYPAFKLWATSGAALTIYKRALSYGWTRFEECVHFT